MDYKSSGVDIEAGNEVVRRIRSLARGTFTAGVRSEIGSFGGVFDLEPSGGGPALVASADGVGTKLKVAFLANRHDTVGADLVNHCVNDIVVQGARPLFFLDYLATGRLSPDVAVAVVQGMARACRENGCALLGGETAEMPGFYADGEYDLAGFIVGRVDRARVIDGRDITPGDVFLGLAFDRAAHERLLTGAADRVRQARAVGRRGDSPAGVLGGGCPAGHAPDVPASGLAVDRRRCGHPARQGDGPHHRRRDHGEPPAHPAGGTYAPASRCRRGRFRRCSSSCARAETCLRTTCCGPSTWGLG